MTKENAINDYKHNCEMAINPKGIDGLERANVQKNALKCKAEWEERFKTSKKYKNDPEIQALLGEEETPEEEEPKEEENEKPKRRAK